MNLKYTIARRYLFGKKSSNTINLITGISVFGLSIGTAAIIIVLSTFNGLQSILMDLFSYFNPDIKIEVAEGKTFELTDSLEDILSNPKIYAYAKTYEEYALFQYNGRQKVARIKGVDEEFKAVSRIDTTLVEGEYFLQDEELDYAIPGLGITQHLGINVKDRFTGLSVFLPNENKGLSGQQFKRMSLAPIASFSIQNDVDNSYVIAPLGAVQNLAGKTDQLTAVELKINVEEKIEGVKNELSQSLGETYKVQDRYEQQADFLRIMNIEKWMSFLILVLAAILVAFNLIGAMWMIVLDKKKDFTIFNAMGMQEKDIGQIMYALGGLISFLGAGIGLLIAVALVFLQKQFALVKVPDSFVMTAYPIELNVNDVLITLFFILLLGILASIPAARRARRLAGEMVAAERRG